MAETTMPQAAMLCSDTSFITSHMLCATNKQDYFSVVNRVCLMINRTA